MSHDGNKQQHLVVQARYGLANRLMALLSGQVLAEALNLKLTVVWEPKAPECCASLGTLFEGSGLEGIDVRETYEHQGEWHDGKRLSGPELLRLLNSAPAPVGVRAYSLFGYDALPGFEFYERLRTKLNALRPTAPVRALIEATPQPELGLHARFSDHLPCHVLTPRWCYREALAVVRAQPGKTPVLVCSDTPSFARELAAAAPDNVVLAPSLRGHSLAPRASLEGVQAALADLWMLAHCRLILGSPASTFAAIACALGGGREVPLAAVGVLGSPRGVAGTWKISRTVAFDWESGRWLRDPKYRGASHRFMSWMGRAAGAVVVRSAYQDRALPGQRAALRRRVAQALGG